MVVAGPQTIQEARRPIQRLSAPQASLIDKFDYDDYATNNGGVMLFSIYNSNLEDVKLNGRILFGGNDYTSLFTHFAEAGGYFFGDDGFPPNTSMEYGLSVISLGLMTFDWLYPITVEVWFEPSSGSSKKASGKTIITVNS